MAEGQLHRIDSKVAKEDMIRQFGSLQVDGNKLFRLQQKTLAAIENLKTGEFSGLSDNCDTCSCALCEECPPYKCPQITFPTVYDSQQAPQIRCPEFSLSSEINNLGFNFIRQMTIIRAIQKSIQNLRPIVYTRKSYIQSTNLCILFMLLDYVFWLFFLVKLGALFFTCVSNLKTSKFSSMNFRILFRRARQQDARPERAYPLVL